MKTLLHRVVLFNKSNQDFTLCSRKYYNSHLVILLTALVSPLPLSCRYKMTCEYTWPHHLMSSDREAVEMIVNQHGFKDDVEYGKTKLFVRTPRSLFSLEQERAALIPILVLFLQKVSPAGPSRLPL